MDGQIIGGPPTVRPAGRVTERKEREMVRTFTAIMALFGVALIVAGVTLAATGNIVGPLSMIFGSLVMGTFGTILVGNWKGAKA